MAKTPFARAREELPAEPTPAPTKPAAKAAKAKRTK